MKRALAGIASQLTALQVGTAAPFPLRSNTVCLFCQHRARTPYAPFSSTASTRIRKRPNRAQATSVLESDQAEQAEKWVEHESSQSADDGIVLGGEFSEAEAKADAQAYQRRRAFEDQEAFQKSVYDAPEQHYVKASNWDGLEMVGGEKSWPHSARKHFNGFLPATKIIDPEQINQAIHRATIEVLLAQSERRPTRKLRDVAPSELAHSQALFVKIEPSDSDSTLTLHFPTEAMRESVYRSAGIRPRAPKSMEDLPEESVDSVEEAFERAPEEDQASAKSEAAAAQDMGMESGNAVGHSAIVQAEDDNTQAASKSGNPKPTSKRLIKVAFDKSWGRLSLSHPAIKLAIIRRVTQLTGHVFPDTTIQTASTISDLSQHIIKSVQRPKTLFQALVGPAPAAESMGLLEELLGTASSTEVRGNPSLNLEHVPGQRKGPLVGLANVVVSGRRVSPVDKEKPVGRWKLIEAELNSRRLPVVGRD